MSRIVLKSAAELETMRDSCRMSAEVLQAMTAEVKPGVTTGELDEKAQVMIKKMGAKPSFLGYSGYPAALCVSINEEVIHGIPGRREILPGDLVSLDVGVYYNGFHGDNATTVMVGAVDPEAIRLVETTRRALQLAIAATKPGGRLSDISHTIECVAKASGCSVVRQFVGHGVGHHLHEEPQIPNYGAPGRGPVLKPGMTLAIEPMVNLGRAEVVVLDDDWTVVTRDGQPSAHFEHTVAVLEESVEILTLA
ncbi:MAG: type I methionyl aminopeptidase [Kiritimatiellae bacterium]|jgi:methionyl aminopeptidase|nr:type I methionyl aminopeptidase [Kiritimatiellia bacterium]